MCSSPDVPHVDWPPAIVVVVTLGVVSPVLPVDPVDPVSGVVPGSGQPGGILMVGTTAGNSGTWALLPEPTSVQPLMASRSWNLTLYVRAMSDGKAPAAITYVPSSGCTVPGLPPGNVVVASVVGVWVTVT